MTEEFTSQQVPGFGNWGFIIFLIFILIIFGVGLWGAWGPCGLNS